MNFLVVTAAAKTATQNATDKAAKATLIFMPIALLP